MYLTNFLSNASFCSAVKQSVFLSCEKVKTNPALIVFNVTKKTIPDVFFWIFFCPPPTVAGNGHQQPNTGAGLSIAVTYRWTSERPALLMAPLGPWNPCSRDKRALIARGLLFMRPPGALCGCALWRGCAMPRHAGRGNPAPWAVLIVGGPSPRPAVLICFGKKKERPPGPPPIPPRALGGMPSHPPGAGWNGTLAGRVLKWRPFSRFPRRARQRAARMTAGESALLAGGGYRLARRSRFPMGRGRKKAPRRPSSLKKRMDGERSAFLVRAFLRVPVHAANSSYGKITPNLKGSSRP